MPENPDWLETYQGLAARVEQALVRGDAPSVLRWVIEQQDVLQRAVLARSTDLSPDVREQLRALLLQTRDHVALLSQAQNVSDRLLGAIASETHAWNIKRRV